MLLNYLKIAWRNLLKSKVFSLINIFGLALGMSAFLFIYQYVQFELSYDTFQPQGERIYRVVSDIYLDSELETQNAFTVPALGPVMQAELPGVADYFRLTSWAESYTIVYETGQDVVTFKEESAVFADPAFVRYFGLEIAYSVTDSLLGGPNRMLISRSTAEKYFGPEWEENGLAGESLLVYNSNRDARITFQVDGVYEDIPANSHLQYDILFSHRTLPEFLPREIPEEHRVAMFETAWNPRAWYTYLVLKEGTAATEVARKITEYIAARNSDEGMTETIWLQPIRDIHLTSRLQNEAGTNGSIQLVYTMMVIAILILCIAWINYINLATARAITRAREVRVRKVVGARRSQLVKQFLLEAGIINLLALGLAVTVTQFMMPYLSALAGIPADFLNGPSTAPWIVFGMALAAGTVFTGIYPALVVSGFRPLNTVRTESAMPFKHGNLRKVLVVFQFVASLSLIVSTLIIYRQMAYMQQQDLGIRLNQIVVIDGPNVLDEESGFRESVDILRNALTQFPAVTRVAAASAVPGSGDGLFREMTRMGSEAPVRELKEVLTDGQYLPMMEAELLAGRFFSGIPEQNQGKMIINEAALEDYGFKAPGDAINARLGVETFGGLMEYEIIGVVKNFHQSSLQYDYEPMGFFCEIYNGDYLVELNMTGGGSGQVGRNLKLIEQEWKKAFPNNPFNYYFLDQYFERQYQGEVRFGKIFSLFSLLTIVIGCLGLFALTSFSVGQRTKEIGIRKLLGASVSSIVLLLSRDLVMLVLIASVIALPLVYYISGQWLENYAFRISIAWWMLVLPVLLVFMLAAAIVSLQTIRTSLMNPVNALRQE